MSNVLISMGGSGTKVAEAFVYLSVAGYPGTVTEPGNQFVLRAIDPDKDNGNLRRLEKLLNTLYERGFLDRFSKMPSKGKRNQRGYWGVGTINYKDDGGNSPSTFTWNIETNKKNETLRDLTTNIEDPTNSNPSTVQPLLEALYSEDDMRDALEIGFQGKPRIGAFRLQYEFAKDIAKDKGFWNSLKNNNHIDPNNTKMMFVGSVFGGTGASGIPNLSSLCRNEFFQADTGSSLGLTLLLPYYKFVGGNTAECPANPNEFNLNTKMSLLYYHMSGLVRKLLRPSIYLIGQSDMPLMTKKVEKNDGQQGVTSTPATTAKGKGDQENPMLPADLTAALAVIDYFRTTPIEGTPVRWCDTNDENDSKPMSKFPYSSNVEIALKRLAVLGLLWKVLVASRPESNEDVLAFRGLKKMKAESCESWGSILGGVDVFVNDLVKIPGSIVLLI